MIRLDRSLPNVWARGRASDYYNGAFGVDGAKFQCFSLLIQNNGGTNRHAFFVDIMGGTQPTRYADKIQGQRSQYSAPGSPNYTYVNTPSVDSTHGFNNAGGGLLASDTGIFVLDTAPQWDAPGMVGQSLSNLGICQLEYYSGNNSRPYCLPYVNNRNVNGVVIPRLEFQLFREGTGVSWNVDSTRLPSSAQVAIRYFGFIA